MGYVQFLPRAEHALTDEWPANGPNPTCHQTLIGRHLPTCLLDPSRPQHQRFYGEDGLGGDAAKRKLLADFGRGDGGFSVEKLLEECEKLG
ncbi:hypothetical protein NUW58_g6169 [Xylaria curta]|uniref:Uncharacterized protein n=1 Tax=Xylaria curta TaxID=42375 RepID=A0ACC1NX58_9PEZI|nr:hypothetical protein NUW58_g6169 [Xylaria curta]